MPNKPYLLSFGDVSQTSWFSYSWGFIPSVNMYIMQVRRWWNQLSSAMHLQLYYSTNTTDPFHESSKDFPVLGWPVPLVRWCCSCTNGAVPLQAELLLYWGSCPCFSRTVPILAVPVQLEQFLYWVNLFYHLWSLYHYCWGKHQIIFVI